MTNCETAELQTFLRLARSRVRPEQVGLPAANARRRVRGLRRDEVAELVGISEGWYSRFEAGRAVLSLSALHRVADALALTRDDRLRLIGLARPDAAGISLRFVQDSLSGIGASIAALRELTRTCADASSVAELGAAATHAVHALSGPGSLAYLREHAQATADLPIVAVSGRNADGLVGHRQRCSSVDYAMKHFQLGRCYGEADIRHSPCVDLHSRVERIGVYAYHSQPIMNLHGLQLLLGVALPEPRVPNDLEICSVEVAAAIVELTLRR